MVTRNRSEMARCAVNGFLAQTYPVRELVILDDGQDHALEIYLRDLADARIRYLRLQDKGAPLGALRNQAVALAHGSHICQWDDDDLYDSDRLAMQMTALVAMKADACFLYRWLIWWPGRKRLAVSSQRLWEGSMLCLKSSVPLYRTIRRGEDTPVADQIAQSGRLALLDQARLYVYVVHESNTFGSNHFESQWLAASEQFSGVAYERMMQELGKRLDLDSHQSALAKSAERALQCITNNTGPSPDNANEILQNAQTDSGAAKSPAAATPVSAPREKVSEAELPYILILTPIKNAAQFVSGYFELVTRLDYPRDKLALAFLEGDSDDETYELLKDHAQRQRADFARIDLHQHNLLFRVEGERWTPEKQFLRRSVIAKCRNKLFKLADRGAEQVLWIDADVIDFPPDVLRRLLELNKPITVPNCVQIPGGPSFDLNSFKFKSGTQNVVWAYTSDGIIQPPRGSGRLYLEDFRGTAMVELDSVGGTLLLVNSDLHRQGILFPDYSYRGYLDTEGFAMHARDLGISCWGVPDLEIVHASQ
jgi:glycosyltransferase involved in cell wall biosynthesis